MNEHQNLHTLAVGVSPDTRRLALQRLRGQVNIHSVHGGMFERIIGPHRHSTVGCGRRRESAMRLLQMTQLLPAFCHRPPPRPSQPLITRTNNNGHRHNTRHKGKERDNARIATLKPTQSTVHTSLCCIELHIFLREWNVR